jgi:hypothetical protein
MGGLFALLLSIMAGLCPATGLQAQSASDDELVPLADTAHLLNRLQALELEHRIVVRDPDAYYLVINVSAGVAELKSGARLLRSAPILALSGNGIQVLKTKQYRYARLIAPVTPEPGSEGARLGGQKLPMDFVSRLTEGPRHRSRLYFTDGLLLQPLDAVCPDSCVCVGLSGPDIKAFGSALRPGAHALLVPPPDALRATEE